MCYSNVVISWEWMCFLLSEEILKIYYEMEVFRDGIWYRWILKGIWYILKCILCKYVYKNMSYLVKLFFLGIWGWFVLIIRNKFVLLFFCDIFFWLLFVKLCFLNMICNKVYKFVFIVIYIIIFEKMWYRLILII